MSNTDLKINKEALEDLIKIFEVLDLTEAEQKTVEHLVVAYATKHLYIINQNDSIKPTT